MGHFKSFRNGPNYNLKREMMVQPPQLIWTMIHSYKAHPQNKIQFSSYKPYKAKKIWIYLVIYMGLN